MPVYFYASIVDYLKNNPHLGDEPIDIEDLVNIGRRSGPCPYFLSRELHKVVDILFAPYNYLIDPGYRRGLGLDWDNSILIFDEAHNLESLCADAASFDLHPGLLTACISEAKNCIDLSTKRQCSDDKSSKPEDFAVLRALLLKLEKRIAEVPINSKELQSIIDILNIIFRDKGTAHAAFYRVHVQEADANAADVLKGKASRTLSWWCFNPGIAMQEFSMMGVGSIILTSGTLSPMESFAQELKLDFPVRLENPHVISSNQIWAGVVPTGPSSYSLNSSYRNRDSLEYKQELGNAIVNIARIVPDGLLIFFPSYYLLDQCIGCWKNMSHGNSTSIWERICKYKKPVVEPRQSALFQMAIEDYMAKLRDTSTSGAVFFAVCRGKVSEGLDFADFAGRAVVITGMPFATLTDPKVRLKREFLDLQAQSQREGYKGLKLPVLTGEDWYNQQASRAVNQAVGRVIRHRHDYGAIIFCDERFAHSNRQSQISLWIQPHIKCYSKYGDMVYMLTRFFRDAAISCPANHKSIKIEDMGKVSSCYDVTFCFMLFVILSTVQKLINAILQEMKEKKNLWSPWINPTQKRVQLWIKLAYLLLKSKEAAIQATLKYFLPIAHPSVLTRQFRAFKLKAIDLSGSSLLDTKPRKEEAIAPCSAKKRKVLNTELDACISNATEIASGAESSQSSYPLSRTCLGKHEKPQISDSRSRQNAEVSALQCKVDGTLRRRDAEFLSQKSEAVLSSVSGDEETKGSTFLIQVKEELSATEYKEFVGFMKALKSKAMKIGHVLQSIANLFSGPERLPLLRRFKDYVPTKYHSIYEQYLPTNG
ncbi:hypothetical protein Patl1_34125 [Pistacia atlantica]|uniref:Uncharacterized protein n=1 Tax=Pistacia atlantica TaxID=434234 RepID=A0ACC0ZT30_9ROSI|nr:hypothetical protein Patl1_34125 [Pistacia atlantica]